MKKRKRTLFRVCHWPGFLLTVVPSSRSVISSVTPEGTVNAESTIVAQSFLLAEALEYPSSPENVQDARLCRLRVTSPGVGAGVGFGAGEARAPETRRKTAKLEVYMVNCEKRSAWE